ncbi:uroplakin-3b [Chiloscyllium plagiosum]|uniref:uroplakin-3b n=1 Tax=Chiloscyllium plagiosum TaxID=36176 RepID=UPI001CB7FCD4|nr:uroplakin-3b [Chiloscyllium plagiosum]
MNRLFRLVLLCAVCGVGSSVPTAISYVPEVVSSTVLGRITQTTVALEQPLCVFNSSDTGCVNCDVWLLVANSSGVARFNSIKNGFVDPSNLMYQDAFSGSNGFYLTVKTKRNVYSCPSTVMPGRILTLRVGAEVPCTTPNCNAPLPTGGTFRMKYVLINPDIRTPNIVAETEFTDEIMLKSATDPNTIVPFSRRTGGMVVITTILSILLFLLLAMFVAMLAMVCCKKSMSSDFPEHITRFDSLRRYNTHSLQKNPGVVSPKGM